MTSQFLSAFGFEKSFPNTSLPKLPALTPKYPKKPAIIYDLSIMNNENEVESLENCEMSMVSSSSQGTVRNNNEETNQNFTNNNAILVHENYCVTEEKKDEKQEKTAKKKGPCRNMICKIKKNKELEKKDEALGINKLEILYKNEIYNMNQGEVQISAHNVYKVSDYLDQNEAGEPDSIPSNSTRNDEICVKKSEKVINKEKCWIF
jgi:hypothetical protein